MLAITNAKIITPEGEIDAPLLIQDGKIRQIGGKIPAKTEMEAEILDASGCVALPGFLDVHIHGGGGADTMEASLDALRTICRTHAQFGTTGLLVTTITQSREKISAALKCAREAYEIGADFCPDGAQVLGIHLEGPYISPLKPGAQPKEFVRDYAGNEEEFAEWLEIAGPALRRITLAPERPGADRLIAICRERDITVSLGHTDATGEQIRTLLETGVADATHLFNAMNGIHHRKPGPIPTFLTHENAMVEIIADGQHVAPDVVNMALRARGVRGVIAITDAMAGAGAGDGVYDLGGHTVTVANGQALLADGTLAGSVLTMAQAAKNWHEWCGLGWSEVAQVMATNTADRMGWAHKGRIAVGADADIALLNAEGTVFRTLRAGKVIF
jgi:N-acetylglucosamine-6-phosphate deacetylase